MELKNNNTIVNLSNSILKHFGCETFHNTIPEIDNLLKSHKKVVVCLYDGFGKYIREIHKDKCPLIYANRVHTIESTFPPTTVAATTGFATAKYPIENGWMSWTQYFDKYKCNIDVFRNIRTGTDEVVRERENSVLNEMCPRVPIFNLINTVNGKQIAFDLGEMGRKETKPWSMMLHRWRINRILKNQEQAYIYYYCTSPDHEIHVEGVESKKVGKKIAKLEKFTKKLVKANKDTLFLVIADHGLIDCRLLDINQFPSIKACLVDNKPISMEKRCPTFFVKEDKKEEFVKLFNQYFSIHFDLYTREEVLEKHIFGDGIQNPQTNQFIGDFLAISRDQYCIYDSNIVSYQMKGAHAGGTKEEMEIDVSAFNI